MAFAVVRTDNVGGTTLGSLLRSAKLNQDIENGSVVKLTSLVEGEREIYKAEAPAGAVMGQFALVASPEKMYDERKRNLDEFINEAGTPFRCYVLTHGDVFSVTEEAFSEAAPKVGDTIALPASGYKWAVSEGTGVGTCISIDSDSGYTYYGIRID